MCIRDRDTGMWVDAGRDSWRIFEGDTGSTLPMSFCDGHDDDVLGVYVRHLYIFLILDTRRSDQIEHTYFDSERYINRMLKEK